MRRLIQVAAATAAFGLALGPTTAANAAAHDKGQWWFNSWHVEQEVWPQTKGSGVKVAVVDTGVTASLPDLKDAVLPGTDFAGGDGRTDSDDEDRGHGTAMASLIAASGKKSGYSGVAPEAKIIPIARRGNLPKEMAEAIRYGADHGAKVINISQGPAADSYPNHCPVEVQSAVAYAAQKDAVIVAAAGNEANAGNPTEFPASCAGVLAVGAIDHTGKAWANSERQDYVTVAAPGAGMTTLRKDGRLYDNGNGTSDAAALTSGAIALLRSKYPDMTARRAVQVIVGSVKDVDGPGKNNVTGYGVVSIRQALANKVPQDAPNPVYERLDKAAASAPKGTGATGPESTKSDDKKSSSNTLLYVGIGVVVVVVLVVGGVVLMRRGKGKNGGGPSAPPPAPMGPPSFGQGQPQQSPYQSGGYQQPSGHGQPGSGAPRFQPPAGGQEPRQ
ncbi:S8 family serine peptidase [Actinomadura gamaensis]|uniref:S8 family serine peptidase n=1 Tax=Actinomadura gamaensis TaxID=1763541 RepID=A0ABV9UBW2_9ACTN